MLLSDLCEKNDGKNDDDCDVDCKLHYRSTDAIGYCDQDEGVCTCLYCR